VRIRRRRDRDTSFPSALLKLFSEQEKVVLWGTRLSDAQMDHIDFSGADLRRSHFVHVAFCGCDFSCANLRDVTFISCDLRGANLTDARLEGASFERSWLSAAQGLTRVQWRYVADRGGLFL
jgi:uncharacterized protein YjbI with pentapeptide repeats